MGVWLLFEAYNLHLRNWYYVNVPAPAWIRGVAYFWSFATIMPGMFETADPVRCLLPSHDLGPRVVRPRPGALASSFVIGVALVTPPLAAPQSAARYLSGAVWIRFIPLLEPVLEMLGIRGVIRDWRQGQWQTAASLLAGGYLCGFWWEAWNYQPLQHTGAYWVYTVPQALRVFGLHYGEMPLLGLGGFLPFALELYAFYLLLKTLLGGRHVFGGPETSPPTTP